MIKKSLIRSFFRTKAVIWLVFAALLIPFAFFFTAGGNPMTPEALKKAGTVFGKDIAWDTFLAHQQWVRLWYPEEFNQMDSSVTQPIIEQETWDRLILLHEAKRQGIKISEQDLAAFIRTMPLFLENGEFIPARYYRLLQMVNMSPSQFEDLLRSTLMVERLIEQNRDQEVQVSEEEVREAYENAYEKARVRIALYPSNDFIDAANEAIEEEELRELFEQRAEDYVMPPQYTVEYAGVSDEEIKESVQISEEEILEAWKMDPAYDPDTEDPSPSDADRERIESQLIAEQTFDRRNALATDLNVAIQNQDSWQDMVEANDLNTNPTIGPITLGEAWEHGEPLPSMLQTMELFDAGFMDVFETNKGIYLGRLVDKTPGRPQTFEEGKETLQRQVAQQKATELAREAARADRETAAQLLQENTIEETITQMELDPLTPGPLHRTAMIPGLGSAPLLNEAALELEAGSVSQAVRIPQGYAVVFVEERLEADPEEFEQFREEVEQQAREAKQEEKFLEWLSDVRARANLESHLEEYKALSEEVAQAVQDS